MLSKIIFFSCCGALFFSGCNNIQKVKPPKIKKVVVKKDRNEIIDMFNNKFHFRKTNKIQNDKEIYQIMYQNYN